MFTCEATETSIKEYEERMSKLKILGAWCLVREGKWQEAIHWC